MGTLEYRFLKESALVAFSPIKDFKAGDDQKAILAHLLQLDAFENFLWLFQDCCVGHEHAFLIHRSPAFTQTSSNIYRGIRTTADGSNKDITLSAERIYRATIKPNKSPPANFATKDNSTRITRTFSLIDRARTSINFAEKIAFYCSGLEALLSTSTSELTHQIAERVALISSRDQKVRICL